MVSLPNETPDLPTRLLRPALGFLVLFACVTALFWYWPQPTPPLPARTGLPSIPVTLDVDGYVLETTTNRPTVEQALAQWDVAYAGNASVTPAAGHAISPYETISIRHRFPVAIVVDGLEIGDVIFAMPVQALLTSHAISLNPLDRIDADLRQILQPNQIVHIVRIVEEIAVIPEAIPYTTSYIQDDSLSIIEDIETQQGQTGTREVTVKRIIADGEIESEEALSTAVISEPVEEIITQGTRIIIGDSEEGYASWYQNPADGMTAASATFPRGTYVRVTSLDTGRSVIVRINDYGPDRTRHPERVIDLNRSAFLDLGMARYTGTTYVTVEELL